MIEMYILVEFSGDNLTGDDSRGITFDGKHYDEYFVVNADGFPSENELISLFA